MRMEHARNDGGGDGRVVGAAVGAWRSPEARGVRGSGPRKRRVAQARCPIRYGEPCTLCQPGANGPEDCQTVAMVMADPELRDMMVEMNRAHRAAT